MTSHQDPNKVTPRTDLEKIDTDTRPYEESDDAKFAHSLSNKPGAVAHPHGDDASRTITNRPNDPNKLNEGDFPPGIDADLARDPGANTPSGRTVDKP